MGKSNTTQKNSENNLKLSDSSDVTVELEEFKNSEKLQNYENDGEKKKKEKVKLVGYWQLFRWHTPLEKCLALLGLKNFFYKNQQKKFQNV